LNDAATFNSGSVHDAINDTESLPDLGDNFLHAFGIGHVATQDERLSAMFFDREQFFLFVG
jgi:hypothetical protein